MPVLLGSRVYEVMSEKSPGKIIADMDLVLVCVRVLRHSPLRGHVEPFS